MVLLAGVAVGVAYLFGRPGVSLSVSPGALVQVHVRGLGAKVSQVRASADGRPIELVAGPDGLVPGTKLAQGETVRVRAAAGAPSWLSWLVGGGAATSTTVDTPTAAVKASVAATSDPGHVPVRFDHTVSVVRYSFDGGSPKTVKLPAPTEVAELSVPSQAQAGYLVVAGAPQSWEEIASKGHRLTYFSEPAGAPPVALVSPAPGSATAASNSSITLTFDQPVSTVLGGSRPVLTPAVAGSWSEPDPDTLVFTPTGFGFGPGTAVTVGFDRQVSAVGMAAPSTVTTTAQGASTSYSFTTGPGSLLRLGQLLAQLHYLPLDFDPAPQASDPSTYAEEVATVSNPLPGTFSWRWSSVPASLRAEWAPGADDEVLKGALMAFAATQPGYDGYTDEPETVAQIATPQLWQELLQAAVAKQYDPNPYAYVYVTESLPETLTVWENGTVVLQSAANTGIASRATALGTYPVYVRYSVNYMDGTNPDGSKYHDLVHWINYFDGGDAVHGFVRSSYGYPQSLGCVELPEGTAQQVFSILAVGDLVTVVPA